MIKDLELKDEVTVPLMVTDLEEKINTKNQPYVTFNGRDKSGVVDCKLWGCKLEQFPWLQNKEIIMIRGTVEKYGEKLQLKVSKGDKGNYLLRASKEEDNISMNDFIKTSPCPYENMISEINEMINRFANEGLKSICLKFISEYEDKLKYYPGAKGVHHAYKTGWLYHIYNMMRMGNTLADIYELNKDLLLSGVLLHDTGKIPAMESDEHGIVEEFSLEGAMLDHIVLSLKILRELADGVDIDNEVLVLIEHMIASHHGQLEWGSPVIPMFPEAEALHHLDNMDSKINTMKEHLDTMKESTFSEKVFPLGRRLYKHKY